ncbi:sensor domain-containing protein [Bacillus salitolerans]|uniref:Sensor domain-containing protein n=1 Tax=Bacillus salitolerans TaxID=1437434 RepID=A0ABW4LLC6_9BACI
MNAQIETSDGLRGIAPSSRNFGRSVIFLLFNFPISVFSFVIMVTGFSLGVGLAITLIGLPILAGTLVFAKNLVKGEMSMVTWYFGIVQVTERKKEDFSQSFFTSIKSTLLDPTNWLYFAYCIFRLPIGILSLVIVITFLVLPLAFLLVPLYYSFIPGGLMVSYVNGYMIIVDTMPEALLLTGIGVILSFISYVIITYTSYFIARFALFIGGPIRKHI